ncbi:beta-glucosidase [Nocardioides albertanoniae]|uniref:beta-glucosidase n=1 Tax=Nocardioides albertanoniae TaxID=1175486 RepID=A0A543AA53_9ACTN|nr:glycoside hydrolase family 3 N-terminal domain-containing protein [Nocardioides albertanoniae]TQL69390.1 beta-glucosidase [Nocardioides albertanoniae]
MRTPHRRRGAIGASAFAGLLCATLLVAPASSAVPADVPTDVPAADAPTRADHTTPYKNPRLSTEKRVDDLLARMTLAEKVGQMAQAERVDVVDDPGQIAELGLGSVLSGGGSVPDGNTPEAWADTVDAFQEQALSTRLGIPLLYGVDSVHGHNNLHGATVFPHNIGLGATRDPKLAERIGHITAEETRATGPQWTFAPCICVAREDRWGRTYESFGEDPKLATKMSQMIEGFQGRQGQLDDPDRVLATAKHFAGDGFTVFGTGEGDYTVDQGITQTSRAEFEKLALSPYIAAVKKHDVGSVMPSFSSVDWTDDGLGNPVKMHANKELVTGWLKEKRDFDGLVISDWRAIHQIPGTYAEQVAASVNAGVDMFMEPFSGDPVGYPQFIETLTSAVEDGAVPTARIDDAVSRILTAKFELGLFEKPFTDRRNIDEIGSEAHRRVAREAVAKSQVLLKNSHRTLPLSGGDDVYVAGSKADSIGDQAGGWTISWQGNSTHQIPGDTILDGISAAARGEVTHSPDASAPVPAGAHGVVVVGEHPYAEGFGDVGGPQWGYDPGETELRPPLTMQISEEDTAAIETVCAAAATCTVLVVSGRPMIVPPDLLGQIDALVACWLPGSEGRGVADVLFGKRAFTGKLPVTWPRSVDQEPINVGDADYDPLYAFGHGLRTRR